MSFWADFFQDETLFRGSSEIVSYSRTRDEYRHERLKDGQALMRTLSESDATDLVKQLQEKEKE